MDEIELVQRCKRHEFAAFEALYQLHHQRALRTAYLVTRSKTAAEDAVQETFIHVWRGIDALREVGAFRSWFYRILHATTHRLGRKEGGVGDLPLDLNQHDKPDLNVPMPEEQVVHGEELQDVRDALSALPDTYRIPLVLRYYSRLTDAEIAEVLNIPIGTVKSRLHNGRHSLQKTLSGRDLQEPIQGDSRAVSISPQKGETHE